jgi:hypothetical protein
MQITRTNRSLIRRLCKELYHNKVDFLAQRIERKKQLAELQEGGVVAIVYGCIDCDSGRWDNRVSLVPATITAVEQWAERYHAQVEGPQWQRLERPSVAADLVEDDRDLALEAFEDGHAHLLCA